MRSARIIPRLKFRLDLAGFFEQLCNMNIFWKLCLCRYGVGGGEVGLEEVVCEGGERHLLRCRHSSVWGVNTTCDHQYDIAIACCRLSICLSVCCL